MMRIAKHMAALLLARRVRWCARDTSWFGGRGAFVVFVRGGGACGARRQVPDVNPMREIVALAWAQPHQRRSVV